MINLYTSPDSPETFNGEGFKTVRWVTVGGSVVARHLWKLSKPGADLVLYTPVEPVTGNVVRPGDFYTEDGARITHDTIPDGMSALVSTTKNAELVTNNFPDWFCAMEDES